MQLGRVQCYLVSLWIILSVTPFLTAHGFSAGTLVAVNNGLHNLEELCLEITEDSTAHRVESFDLHSRRRIFCAITSVAQSEVSCFCNIIVGPHRTTISCSPLQEFYVVGEQCWKPAGELVVSDRLLTAYNTTCEVHAITFIRAPLQVYTLEVEDTHIFTVTPQHILTHNIFLPAVTVGLSIPWGAGACGTVGGFFGPVTCAVGLAVGGLIGLMWQKCSRSEMPHYKVVFDAERFASKFMPSYIDNTIIFAQDNKGVKDKIDKLPQGGEHPFKPKKTKNGELLRDRRGGFIDKNGNSWIWDEKKQEWDVQLDGGKRHKNVSPQGHITH